MIGILLAGGHASRLGGGDKGDHRVGGLRVVDRLIATMRRQCDGLVLNAAGDPARFASLGLPVIPDSVPGQVGPLAGILAGLDHVAAHHSGIAFAVTTPIDTPFLPADLVARLEDVREADRAAIVCARSGGRWHYPIALWAVELRHDLRRVLAQDDDRKVRSFVERHTFAGADWPVTPFDPFFNINTPEDLAEAERIARLAAN